MFHNFFEQFEGGGHRQRHPQERQKVDTKKYYDILGVSKDATTAQIKKAFRKQAMKHHPDRGGDQDKFKELNKVYDTLSNSEKRELYDKGGEEAVERGNSGGGEDPFSHFFGGGGGGGSKKGKKKGQDAMAKLTVTLEELCNGATKELRFKKQTLCDVCHGTGGKGVRTCGTCDGRGSKMIMRQLGPGMIQQIQTHCDECNGQGEIIPRGSACKRCRGRKVSNQMKTLSVHINKGMKHNQKIKFREEADQAPNTIPGDLIVKLDMKKHPRFHREGAHLFYKKSITLLESIVGFAFSIKTLESRTLIVKSNPDIDYAPNSVRAIRDEGMPQEANPSVRGNLYIIINVDFPDVLEDKAIRSIKKVLPEGRSSHAYDDDVDVVTLKTVNMDDERQKWKEERQQSKNQYDSDDDEPRRGHTAQCQTQ